MKAHIVHKIGYRDSRSHKGIVEVAYKNTFGVYTSKDKADYEGIPAAARELEDAGFEFVGNMISTRPDFEGQLLWRYKNFKTGKFIALYVESVDMQ